MYIVYQIEMFLGREYLVKKIRGVRIMVSNATVNNISVILWRVNFIGGGNQST